MTALLSRLGRELAIRRRLWWDSRRLRFHRLGRKECGLIADYGIGDHLIVLAFAEAVSSHHGLTVRAVAGASRFTCLRDLFQDPPEYIPWQGDPLDARWADRLTAGRFYYAHFPGWTIADRIGADGFHFLDAYRMRLSLPPHAGLTPRVQPDEDAVGAARQRLARLGLPAGRTVLMATDSTTTPTGGDHTAFWRALAEALIAHGWTPVVNGGPGTSPLSGLTCLPAPLADVRALAVAAGAVVSIRSGLSDLTCDLHCRRTVVFPDVRWYAGTLQEGTTFSRYGLHDPPVEVVLGNAASAVERILEGLSRPAPWEG